MLGRWGRALDGGCLDGGMEGVGWRAFGCMEGEWKMVGKKCLDGGGLDSVWEMVGEGVCLDEGRMEGDRREVFGWPEAG